MNTYDFGLMTGARNLRNGVYDETAQDRLLQDTRAHEYLTLRGVLDFRYDRDYSGLYYRRAEQAARFIS